MAAGEGLAGAVVPALPVVKSLALPVGLDVLLAEVRQYPHGLQAAVKLVLPDAAVVAGRL